MNEESTWLKQHHLNKLKSFQRTISLCPPLETMLRKTYLCPHVVSYDLMVLHIYYNT